MTLKKKSGNKAFESISKLYFLWTHFFVLLAVLNITRAIYLYITRDKTFIHKKI